VSFASLVSLFSLVVVTSQCEHAFITERDIKLSAPPSQVPKSPLVKASMKSDHSPSKNLLASNRKTLPIVSPQKGDHSPLKKPSGIDRLPCVAIDWLSPTMVEAEIRKYDLEDDNIPENQEDRLEFLMLKFKLEHLKAAYYITASKVGSNFEAMSLKYNARMNDVVLRFISLIYDHRSMMYDDSRDAYR
jgi:hypothetical protein